MKWMRLRILGGVLALAVTLMHFVVWKNRPQTKYATGFSEAAFNAIQRGEAEAAVIQRLGNPLAMYSEETVEEWCFGNGQAEPGQGRHWIGRVRVSRLTPLPPSSPAPTKRSSVQPTQSAPPPSAFIQMTTATAPASGIPFARSPR